MWNSSIWPVGRTLFGATTTGQSGPGSNGNEGVLNVPQSSKTRASPLYCLMSYQEYSLGEVLPLCRNAVDVFFSPSRLDYSLKVFPVSFKLSQRFLFLHLKEDVTIQCITISRVFWGGYFFFTLRLVSREVCVT